MGKQRGHTADFCMLTAELTPFVKGSSDRMAAETNKVTKNLNTALLI